VVRDASQDSTDLTKCLAWLRRHGQGHGQGHGQRLDVLALGGLGGRVDQAMSQIHHLYLAGAGGDLVVRGAMYLVSEQSVSFVLARGVNVVALDGATFARHVGILPVAAPAVISTRGLQWDVRDWRTEFGGQVSTSNRWRDGTVEVRTDEPVLFTVELARHLTLEGGEVGNGQVGG